MEVKLDKRYAIEATREQCWAVLSDIRATAACMPGAAITEQVDDTHYKGTVRSKVGPAVMSFGGDIEVRQMDTAAQRLQMIGKGADRSGSSAQMDLTAHLEPGEHAGQTTLVGVAEITVSGKLAQFGSRLLVPVSDAMLAQFADNFRAAAAAVPVAVAPVAVADVDPAVPGAAAGADAALAASAAAVPPPRPSAPAPAPAPVQELNALGLMWTVFKGWLAGLFGKRA